MANYNFALHNVLEQTSSTPANGIQGAFSIFGEGDLTFVVNNAAYNSSTNPPNTDGNITTIVEQIDVQPEIRIRVQSISNSNDRIIPSVPLMTFGREAMRPKLRSDLQLLGFGLNDADPTYIGLRRIVNREQPIGIKEQTIEYGNWVAGKLYYQSPIVNSIGITQQNHLSDTANTSMFRGIGFLGYNRGRGSSTYSVDSTNNANGLGPDSVVLVFIPNKELDPEAEYELYVNTTMPSYYLAQQVSANPEAPAGGGGGAVNPEV